MCPLEFEITRVDCTLIVDFNKVYGESALTVASWVSLFRAGRENIHDEPHSRRPSISVVTAAIRYYQREMPILGSRQYL